MILQAGDTFKFHPRFNENHLWLVLSDVGQDDLKVIIVNMTTYQHWKEDCCLLNHHDHPTITHGTCIIYEEARHTSLAKLTSWVADGTITLNSPLAEEVLERIRRGAFLSKRLKYDYRQILIDQDLI